MDRECCGTCAFHRKYDGEWICTNEEVDYCGLETDYKYYCDEYEERE